MRAHIEQYRDDDQQQVNALYGHAVRDQPCIDDGSDGQENEPDQRDDEAMISPVQHVREKPHQHQDHPGEQEHQQDEDAGHVLEHSRTFMGV